MASAAEQKAFINLIGPIAVKVCKERGYGNAQVWTCIAQACCESNYGSSKIMKNANAFFGIKASKSWVQKAKYGGLVYNAGTKECYDGKTYTNITACFRAYNSMDDSVRDYFDLLEMDRYKACLTKNTVKECVTCIKNGGYATAPTYINTIVSFYTKYQSLIEGYNVDNSPIKASVDSQTSNSLSSTKKSLDEVAGEVIKGKYGNGSARKAKLEAEGYNYSEVQARVNALCKK